METQTRLNEQSTKLLADLSQQLQSLMNHNKSLETQISQLAQAAPRPQGSLPGQPEDTRRQLNVVTLRSGKEYEGPTLPIDDEQIGTSNGLGVRTEIIPNRVEGEKGAGMTSLGEGVGETKKEEIDRKKKGKGIAQRNKTK